MHPIRHTPQRLRCGQPETILVTLAARAADNVCSEARRQFSLLTGQWNFAALRLALQVVLAGKP
jgi:hypothetical protein